MRYWIYSLIILASLGGVPAIASDREDRNWEDEAQIELQIQATPRRYTFQDYMSDLKDSTRSDQMDLDNPVHQLSTVSGFASLILLRSNQVSIEQIYARVFN